MVRNFFILLCSLWLGVGVAQAGERDAEVIHWWVSGGERKALQVVIDAFEAEGYHWVDTPVANSFKAKTAALSRMFDGYPPALVQWHAGVSLGELDSAGLLGDIDTLARQQNWQKLLPGPVFEAISNDNKVVAIPMTIHGSNWLWGSRKVLDASGVKMPGSLEDFFEAAKKVRDKGFIPLALGGQAWQERVLFLTTLLAVGGSDFYNKTIVEHQPEALGGELMEEVFRQFRKFGEFIDPMSPGRSWSDTTRLVVEGKAAFQFMGDWAKGEFLQAGQVAGEEYFCSLAPGTQNNYLLITDVFAMGKVSTESTRKSQLELARLMMDRDVQRTFNRAKGSIPPRNDVGPEGFDDCARIAMGTVYGGGSALLPGFNMANSGLVGSSIMDVISAYWNDTSLSPAEGAKRLKTAVENSILK